MAQVTRLREAICPQTYHLDLAVDMARFTFELHETINFELIEASNTITWHAVNVSIATATIDGQTVTFTMNASQQTVTFEAQNELAAGNHILELALTGIIQDSLHGFYRSRYEHNGSEQWLAVTQFEAVHAREALVCIDEPAAKAVFELSVTADESLTVLSNTAEASRVVASGRQTVTFAPTPKMSTYLLAYVIGALESVQTVTTTGVLVRAFATAGQSNELAFALDTARQTLAFYSAYFDIAYPLPKLDMVAIPDFGAGAMENWGLVTYRETDLLINEQKSSLANRQRVALVVAHELAHQWFGNLVTMSWWNDLWLNESFASWAETMTLMELFPQWDSWCDFVTSYGAYARELDALTNTHPIEVEVEDPSGIDEIFDAISYYKGQGLLWMLHDYIGAEPFRDGLQIYLKRHQYANTHTTDLWTALTEASGQPVADIMAAWTSQPGYPLVTLNLTADVMTVSQQRFTANSGQEALLWPVPITFTSSLTGLPERQLLAAKTADWPAKLGATDWITANNGQRGFYRVRYDDGLLHQLSNRLMSFEAVGRFGLLSDQFALAAAGLASTTGALDLTLAARGSRDYPTWMAIFDGLGEIVSLLEAPHPLRPELEAYAVWLTGPLVEALGWEERANDSPSMRLLRSRALLAAGRWGNPAVRQQAEARFAGRAARGIPADLQGIVYGVTATFASATTFDELRQAYLQESQPQVAEQLRMALALVREAELIQTALKFALSAEVRPQDSISVLGRLLASPNATEAAWRFMTEQWPELERRYGHGGHMLERLPQYVGAGPASEAAAARVEDFFLVNHPSAATKRPALQAAENLRTRAAWLKRDQASITAWLDEAARNR